LKYEAGIMKNGKIRSFTDLDAWKKGHELVLMVYKITKSFPNEEVFGLTIQMRRSAVSSTSNIAEGFSRHTHKEKIQFYSIALGSVTELQNQL
jgi:four helix bundle protein